MKESQSYLGSRYENINNINPLSIPSYNQIEEEEYIDALKKSNVWN